MKTKSRLLSFVLAATVALGSMPAVPTAFAEATTYADVNIADYAKENNMLRYDSSLSYESDAGHLQGMTTDDELGYMYVSYGDAIVKMDMESGAVVGSVEDFGVGGSMVLPYAAHMGSIEYYDGYIYCAMIAVNPSAKCFVVKIKADAINKVGLKAEEMSEGCVEAILLEDITKDYRDKVSDVFTGWRGLGNFTMDDDEGHRFGTGGVDGITVGTYPGEKNGDKYIIVSQGIYYSKNNIRQDNTYTILKFYPLSSSGTKYSKDLIKDTNYTSSVTAAKTLFAYTGNINYGPQNLEYEETTGDIVAYCYEHTDFDELMYDSNGRVSRVMVCIDGSVAPTEKILELGQNNTLTDENNKAYVKAIADAYSTDTDGDGAISDDERLKGPVGAVKCVCGDHSKHSVETVGEATWGDTGVKKSEYPICAPWVFGTATARGDEGVSYIGEGSDGNSYYYSRGGWTGTEVNLWKRTIDQSTGKWSYALVEPTEEAKQILHYSMDSSDIVTVDDVKYLKNTLDETGKYSAVVQGTSAGKGVDGTENGAISFNAYNYPYAIDQIRLSDETVRYIDTKIHNSDYSYSFWAKMATGGNTDSNFVPFVGMYREDGTYAGVFEQRWRGEIKYVVNGIGSNTAGNPGDEGISIGNKDNGWHFYTVTEKAGNGTVYCDGNRQGTYSVSNTHLQANHITDFIIGGGSAKIWYDKNNRGRFTGSIDDLSIYSGALTAAEVKAAYNSVTKRDTTKVTAATADVNTVADEKLRASYDTVDSGDLTVDVGVNVSQIANLTANTDFTVSGTHVTLKAEWLKKQRVGIINLDLGDSKMLELTITDKNTPVLKYNFDKSSITGSVVKDSGVYKKDAKTSATAFDYSHNGNKNGALVFDGYNYAEPDYVTLSDESTLWLNSVIKTGYTMNFWARAASENGSVMSMAGLYAADARPLGVVESYEPSSSAADNSTDGKMLIHADIANSNLSKANAVNSQAIASADKMPTLEWHMYTISYDKNSNTVKLYIDGEVKNSGQVNADIIGNIAQLSVGHQYKKYYNATGTFDWLTCGGFDGAIDGISVYNNALNEDAVKALFSGETVDDSIIILDDDFEGYKDTLGGNWSEAGTGEVSIGTENGNTFLNLTQKWSNQSKWVENMFNKTYTDGSIYVNYRVKPSQGSATMFWLIQEKDKTMLRLPLFTEDGKIKVTGASVAETEVGTYTAGKWYDVSAKFDIDTGLADITVQESGTDNVMKKTGMPTGLTSVCGLRMQIWGAVGTSNFDNVNVRYEAPKADSSDAYIIYDDFENGISDKYTSVGTSGTTFNIGTEGSNHFLNITKATNQDNVHIRRYLDKKQTTGTVHISYKVKPQNGGSTMFWINSDMRLPFFGSDGSILTLEKDYDLATKAERKVGVWQSGCWYDVSITLDLDAKKYDFTTQKSGDASSAVSITGDYMNLTNVEYIGMQMYGTAGTSSFDELVIYHENTSSAEKLLFKDDFNHYKNDTLQFNKDYNKMGGSGATAAIKTVEGEKVIAINRNGESNNNVGIRKYLSQTYTTGVIDVKYSIKPVSGVSTMFWLKQQDNNQMIRLALFGSDGEIVVDGNTVTAENKATIGTFTPGKWYDVSASFDLVTGLADITVQERGTNNVMQKTGIVSSLRKVGAIEMQAWSGDTDSYFDNVVVTQHPQMPKLPYAQDFESGTLDKMTSSGSNDDCKIVDSNDGHGKVYQIQQNGDGAPALIYNVGGGLNSGMLKIEADVKTGSATHTTLLQINSNQPNLVRFSNNSIWFEGKDGEWETAKYANTRAENQWYHIKAILNLDTGMMNSWVTAQDGTVYTLKNQKYADANTTISNICFRVWDQGTSWVDNVSITVPTDVSEFTLLNRTFVDNGAEITTLEALKNAESPSVSIKYDNTTGQDKAAWVFVNAYKNGSLLWTQPEMIIISAAEVDGVKNIPVSDKSFDEADTVNVLVWEDVHTMIPIFEALELNAQTNAE